MKIIEINLMISNGNNEVIVIMIFEIPAMIFTVENCITNSAEASRTLKSQECRVL